MVEPTNSFEWARKLECPANACTETVKKILSKGILELLWTEIGNASFTNKEIREVRKNLLLYKLRHRLKDTNIECIENIAHLKVDKKRLKVLSSSLKEEYEQQEFSVRQQVEQLRSIKSKYSLVKTKKELLKLKHSEICTQLCDCNNMRLICKNLMPKTSEDLNQDMMKESLNAVTTLWFGATKREVKAKILNLIGDINIPTLWTHLYQGLCQDLDNLIQLRTTTTSESTSLDNLGKEYLEIDAENIDTGIARLCGKHISLFSKRLYSEKKANEYQDDTVMYIEKIETSVENHPDLCEWICLALEVRKLEVEQEVLRTAIKTIQSECDESGSIVEIKRLSSEIQRIHSEIDTCVEDIQQSLTVLKYAESIIIRQKDKLHTELMNLLAVRTDTNNFEWFNNGLNTELNIFYDVLDIRALRKIILKGNIRNFRHEACTMKEASIVMTPLKVSNIMPYFPMVQAPIYCLIDCYKNLITNYTYQNIKALLTVEKNELPISIDYKSDYNTMELLMLAERSCAKAQEEIDAIHIVLKNWNDQTVEVAMALVKETVDKLSFTEWKQRYTLLLYMLKSAASE